MPNPPRRPRGANTRPNWWDARATSSVASTAITHAQIEGLHRQIEISRQRIEISRQRIEIGRVDGFRFIESSHYPTGRITDRTYTWSDFLNYPKQGDPVMPRTPGPFKFAYPDHLPEWALGEYPTTPNAADLIARADAANVPYPRVFIEDAAMFDITNRYTGRVTAWVVTRTRAWCLTFDIRTPSAVLMPTPTQLARLRQAVHYRLGTDLHVGGLQAHRPVEMSSVTRAELLRACLESVGMSARRPAMWGPTRLGDSREWRLLPWASDVFHIPTPSLIQRRAKELKDLGAAVAQCLRLMRDGVSPGFALEESGVATRTPRGMGSSTLDRIASGMSAASGVEFIRASCGHLVARDDAQRVAGGRRVCPDCFEEDYVLCVDTDDYRHREDVYYWEDDDCYRTYASDLDDEDDEDDSDSRGPDGRMDYSTNVMRYLSVDPSFSTRPDGDFHMGLELETIVTAGGVNAKVREVRAELGPDYLVAKYDGSLDSNKGEGVEWVTRPTSMTTHVSKLKGWSSSVKGLVAWDAGCCGMHIHIDSHAFTPTTLGKMLQFFNAEGNVDFVRNIAGRHPDRDRQAQSYAARDLQASEAATPMRALKGKSDNPSRYAMVNLTNLRHDERERLRVPHQREADRPCNTVEIRIYKASLNKLRLLSQIEFTHALIMYCRQASFRKMDGANFVLWLAEHTSTYPHLATFLKVAPHKHGKRTQEVVAGTVEV